ncbi:MAG: formimidoylglutamate deiminase [Marinicaulis sp.]|nr:formimidoylglutamate deiminase [Marinicaulis sp.]
MNTIWAEQALTAKGWVSNVSIEIGADGRINVINAAPTPPVECTKVGILLPAPSNLHSHAFQRAMAGMTEYRGDNPNDSFWTWRILMYRFLDQLTPDDIEAITAFVQMEMLEAGYAGVAEFHYLHHQPDGAQYDDIAELSNRIAAAAVESGIGLTLLPVLYEHGGCDGRALQGGQCRFGNDVNNYEKLFEGAVAAINTLPDDAQIGVAAHSLRAVSREGLKACRALVSHEPMHIHIAEQIAEVEEVKAAWGLRPVEWLIANHDIDEQWCLIHATQMEAHETIAVAKSGAVVGLCPITEGNLGDGIFDGVRYLQNNGRFGIGADSNIRISLSEELRMLEYTQRLRDHGRAVLATQQASTGRVLMDGAARGGAQAAGRESGAIEVGRLADFFALDADAIDIVGKEGDAILDSFIFASDDSIITDVWSAGRHMVKEGRHIKHDAISARYRTTIQSLKARI